MSEYVGLITLEVNGKEITDFKSAEEKEIDYHKAVNLMNKTGAVEVTPRYGVNVEYVVPTTGEFDFTAVKDGTLSINRTGGSKISFTGVYTLKIGNTKYDGDKEAVRTIELMATGRTEA